MTSQPPKASPLYPKTHLIAASGIAVFLSLALLVLPYNEVEAKRTILSLGLESPVERLVQEQDATGLVQATPSQLIQVEQQDTVMVRAEEPKALNHREVVVAKGDTLSKLFETVGLPAASVHKILASDKQAKQFSQLKHGQKIEFEMGPDGNLTRLYSQISNLEAISLSKTTEGYTFLRVITLPTVRSAYVHGVITNSLSASSKRAGLPHSMTMNFAKVFGYDINFSQDIRTGDQFEVIYEQKVVNGKTVGTGDILSARLTNHGKTYTAVRYTNQQGISRYYTADGHSMRKTLIRTPVDFTRISSRFSPSRKHPILNKTRAHEGVDYAAPRGAPIKAAGDGKVLLAGRRGGYGNTIIIQHGNTYRTLYGHMQGFAKGVKSGGFVKQGQVIGYIGTTGLSTGPHLHYELQVNGVHVDPLGQKPPTADLIAKTERIRFLQQSRPLIARMNQEMATLLASSKR